MPDPLRSLVGDDRDGGDAGATPAITVGDALVEPFPVGAATTLGADQRLDDTR